VKKTRSRAFTARKRNPQRFPPPLLFRALAQGLLYYIQISFGDRSDFEEIGQLVAGIFCAIGTVIYLLLFSAFPYFTNLAIIEKLFGIDYATQAIDVRRLQIHLVIFGPSFRHFPSLPFIVLLGGDERRAFGTDQSAYGYHLFHKLSFHYLYGIDNFTLFSFPLTEYISVF
jgi:hypothetical protein